LSLLELRDVGARYGEIHALRGVTLSVADGDFVALLGANGAGKTTTLRAVSGTVKTSGGVLLDGQRLYRRTPEGMAREGVAHVPAPGGTFGRLSVLDNLRAGAWVHGSASPRDLAHVFEFFPRLYDRRAFEAGRLAAGEQRMLALGRAMMAKPRLLLFDEPSLGLPPRATAELYDVLRRLNGTGTAIVVVEQNPGVALRAARHAFVLETGRVVLQGDASELLGDESVRRTYLGY
jgi:branched-chain amino acid transport system ATP-binding protein